MLSRACFALVVKITNPRYIIDKQQTPIANPNLTAGDNKSEVVIAPEKLIGEEVWSYFT